MITQNKSRIVRLFIYAIVFVFTSNLNAQDSLFIKISNLVDSVSTVNLENSIEWLQSPAGHNSRVNFTPGNDSAASYIYSEFKNMPGITSVELDTFYIDEVFVKIQGKQHYLWRAVNQDGEVDDVFLQQRRDGKAAKRFFK